MRSLFPSPLPAALTLTAALASAVVACGGSEGVPDATPGYNCDTNQAEANLDWIQENVFSPSCSDFSVCHMGRALMASELSLEAGRAHAELVGQPSVLFEQYQRVVPGDPANSYLMIILGHAEGPLGEKGTMPYNSPLLPDATRDAIWCWIEAGAIDPNAPDAGVPDATPVDADVPDAGP